MRGCISPGACVKRRQIEPSRSLTVAARIRLFTHASYEKALAQELRNAEAVKFGSRKFARRFPKIGELC